MRAPKPGSWASGQPMPMLGRPCVLSLSQLPLLSNFTEEVTLWYWGADPDCMDNIARTMRCNEPGIEPEGNQAELQDWILRFATESWLVADCRNSVGMPRTVSPLVDLLRNMPCPVLALVDDVTASNPFPPWTPIL